MEEKEISDFLKWLEKKNIHLRTEVHSLDTIRWALIFKDINQLSTEYNKAQPKNRDIKN
jgi:hypothetical protein